MAGDAWAAAEQQLVAFEGRGAVEVGVAGTGLTEQVLGKRLVHHLLQVIQVSGLSVGVPTSIGSEQLVQQEYFFQEGLVGKVISIIY